VQGGTKLGSGLTKLNQLKCDQLVPGGRKLDLWLTKLSIMRPVGARGDKI
jgi:hypothetical protein